MPTAAVMPSGTMPKQTPWPCARCWCDHSTKPANLASVGGGGAMYAVTAGSENNVNSVSTSDAATSRSVVRSPCRGGTRSVHPSTIEYPILSDGRTDHYADRPPQCSCWNGGSMTATLGALLAELADPACRNAPANASRTLTQI